MCDERAERESLIGIIVRMHRSVALSRYTISALGAIIITVCLYAPLSILSSRQCARLYLITKLDWRNSRGGERAHANGKKWPNKALARFIREHIHL